MFDFLKKIFGTKSEKDVRNLEARVTEINDLYNTLGSLTNDELRGRSAEMRSRLSATVKDEREKISTLKKSIEVSVDMDVDSKEALYKEIDELEKKVTEKLDEALDRELVEAFAILKETARRFKENEELEVAATDTDRELAKSRNNVEIRGDKAVFRNKR